MKVNQISANQPNKAFGALHIEANRAHYNWIKDNVVPTLGKNPAVAMLDKMGLDVLVKDIAVLGEKIPFVSVVAQGNPQHFRFVDELPLTKKGGALTKKLKTLPQELKKTAIKMLGGSKDYVEALINDTLKLQSEV